MDFWRESYRRCIQASFCTNIDTVTLVIVIAIVKDPAISQNLDHFIIMQYNYAVCGDTSKQPLSTCLKCSRPCHSKCLGKRKGGECDICRKAKQQQLIKQKISPQLLTQLQDLTKQLPRPLRKPRKANHLHRKSLGKLNHLHCTSPARNVNGYATLKDRKRATISYANCVAKRNNSGSLASNKLHHLRSQMALSTGPSRRARVIYRVISMTRQLRRACYMPA